VAASRLRDLLAGPLPKLGQTGGVHASKLRVAMNGEAKSSQRDVKCRRYAAVWGLNPYPRLTPWAKAVSLASRAKPAA